MTDKVLVHLLQVWKRLVKVVELLGQGDGIVGRLSVFLGEIHHT